MTLATPTPMTDTHVVVVPGVGESAEVDGPRWVRAVRAIARRIAPSGSVLNVSICPIDDLFAGRAAPREALRELFASDPGARNDAWGHGRTEVEALAGWVADPELRRRARERLVGRLPHRPEVCVLAHGIGTLVALDTLACEPDRSCTLVTMAGPLGHRYVQREHFAGRLVRPRSVRRWIHLHARDNDALSVPPRIHDQAFHVRTVDGSGRSHGLLDFLRDPAAMASAWTELAVAEAAPAVVEVSRPRALLVGIDAYEQTGLRLRGCARDVFAVSAFLQEIGYAAEDIRVVLDQRATRDGIVERLRWLTDDVRPGDQRLFYYSGHGAQLPTYGDGDRVDRMDETLVPVDFDWSPERALTDDLFAELYGQLPYDARFFGIFDCCHAGGMTRGGLGAVRGLEAPLDVGHRAQEWDPVQDLWRPRRLPASAVDGEAGRCTHRLGSARALQPERREHYESKRRQQGHHGPFRPTLLFACAEHERAREIEQGSAVHGAFTFCLLRRLRSVRDAGGTLDMSALCAAVTEDLRAQGCPQTASASGPSVRLREVVPWLDAPRSG